MKRETVTDKDAFLAGTPGLCFPAIVTVALFLCLGSCSSVPPAAPLTRWLSLVPDEASFLVYAKEPRMLALLFDALSKKMPVTKSELNDVLRSTDIGLFYGTENGDGKRSSALVLIGRYSAWSIDTGLSCSGKWTKIPGPGFVWKHNDFPVTLANPHGYMIVITDGDMQRILGRIDTDMRTTAVSERAIPLIENADCAFYVSNPGDRSLGNTIPFNREKVPLSEIVVTLRKAGTANDLSAGFFLSSPPQGSIFATSLRTFVVWIMRKCGILNFTNRIMVEENDEGAGIRFSSCTDEEAGRILALLLEPHID
jgi:hypothetical protein